MFDPWVGKISWRRERLPTPVFWPGGLLDYIVHGVTKSWTGLSAFHFHILAVVNNAAFNMGVSVGISLSSNFTYFGYGDIPRMELLDVQSFYFKFFVGPPFCFP